MLDLDQQIARADGVKSAARDEKSVSCFHLEPMHEIRGSPLAHRLLELLPGHAGSQSRIDFRAVIGRREIPHFGLGFTAQSAGRRSVRMHLQGELLVGVKHLGKDGKAR